jgi:hypothetical protein
MPPKSSAIFVTGQLSLVNGVDWCCAQSPGRPRLLNRVTQPGRLQQPELDATARAELDRAVDKLTTFPIEGAGRAKRLGAC